MAKTNTAVIEDTVANVEFDFDFSEFASDLEVSSSIPYAQFLTPPNLPVKDIKAYNKPYGLFVIRDQADAVNFQPDENWKLEEITFGEEPNEEKQIGYRALKARFVIISRSAVEVERQVDGKWTYEGLAYNGNVLSDLGKKAKDKEEKFYRDCIRLLVFFVDENNNLLHDSPLQLKLRGGFKGTLSTELKKLYEQTGKVYSNLAKEKGIKVNGNQLSDIMRALTVITCEFDVHKPPSVNGFTVPSSVEYPALNPENVGKTITEDRSWDNVERKINIKGVTMGRMLISKVSQAGQTILTAKESYKEYGTARSNANAPKPYKASGQFSTDGISFNSDGSATVVFMTDAGNVKVVLRDNQVEALDNENAYFQITGTISNGVVTPKLLGLDMSKTTEVSEGVEISNDDF